VLEGGGGLPLVTPSRVGARGKEASKGSDEKAWSKKEKRGRDFLLLSLPKSGFVFDERKTTKDGFVGLGKGRIGHR